MARMNLFNSSCQADEIYQIYCKAHANVYLQCDNAVLVYLKTKNGHEHIVWMNENAAEQGNCSYVRAFYEPQNWEEDDLGDAKYQIIIRPDIDVFCYNGNIYFLYATQNHNNQIRRLKAYCSQTIVEAVEYQTYHKMPQAVFLSNFYTLDGKGKNYALTCWGIAYENETHYLPVFDEDRHYLEEKYQLSQFMREELVPGDVFKNNGYYYKVLNGKDGKLELEQAKSVFMFGKADDYPTIEPVKTAKIISVNFAKNQGGG